MARKSTNVQKISAKLKNNDMLYHYFWKYLGIAISMFEWKGLPKEIDYRYLEYILISQGMAVAGNSSLGVPVAGMVAPEGRFNNYEVPRYRRYYTINGHTERFDSKNSVMIYNSFVRKGDVYDILLFADRIAKHEEVCARMSTKKKKVFDGSKMRLQGTEAAKYVTKESKQPEKRKPSKYKQEHEKLVQALQAARKIQEYEKAKEQGKAVGPPPELPKYEMEDDDRVQCPYCGRKFGSEVAQKHIAVCERMNGNKMRGGAANRRGGRR